MSLCLSVVGGGHPSKTQIGSPTAFKVTSHSGPLRCHPLSLYFPASEHTSCSGIFSEAGPGAVVEGCVQRAGPTEARAAWVVWGPTSARSQSSVLAVRACETHV